MTSSTENFLASPGFWLSAQTIFAWVFLILDLALLVGFVYAFRNLLHFRPVIKPGKKHPTGMGSPQLAVFRDRWMAVKRRFDINSQEAMRSSILEADMLVDSILKDAGLEGETIADRLSKISPETLSSVNQLWKAHRLRNQLSEKGEFEVSPVDAENAIAGYEAFLKEVKVL